MALALSVTAPLVGLLMTLGAAPPSAVEAPSHREQIHRILFQLQNSKGSLTPLLEKLTQDALHSTTIPAAEGFPFLKEANAATLEEFSNMPVGLRIALDSALTSVPELEDPQGRAVLLHTNLVLAENAERYSGTGLPLLRSLLGLSLQRGRLNRLTTSDRYQVLRATLSDFSERSELFPEAQQVFSLKAALVAAEAPGIPFQGRNLLYQVVNILFYADAGDSDLFYQVASSAGRLEHAPSALAALRSFATQGRDSALLPADHRAALGQALEVAAAAPNQTEALAVLRQAFASLLG
jgi:hypothetical protein